MPTITTFGSWYIWTISLMLVFLSAWGMVFYLSSPIRDGDRIRGVLCIVSALFFLGVVFHLAGARLYN